MNRILLASLITASVLGVSLYQNKHTQPSTNRPQPNQVAIAATTKPTVTPQPIKCPHTSQLLITPLGGDQEICVYRLGSVGSELRTQRHKTYDAARKRLEAEGKTPQEIENELYQMDYGFIQTMMENLNS